MATQDRGLLPCGNRAVNEHDTFLQSESLQILRRLMIVCDLDTDLLKYLIASKKGNLLSFWNSIIRKLSLEAEGVINSKAKQMVKLGFCLSAVYAGLIEQLNSNNDQELEKKLVRQYILKPAMHQYLKNFYNFQILLSENSSSHPSFFCRSVSCVYYKYNLFKSFIFILTTVAARLYISN